VGRDSGSDFTTSSGKLANKWFGYQLEVTFAIRLTSPPTCWDAQLFGAASEAPNNLAPSEQRQLAQHFPDFLAI